MLDRIFFPRQPDSVLCSTSSPTQPTKVQAWQNKAVQRAYINALRTLTESIQQRVFNHIFTSIPVFDDIGKEFYEWVKRLE